MKYLIGIDIGTSGTKSALYDTEGRLVASADAEYPMSQPKVGWAEENPEHWWEAVCKTLSQICPIADGEIVGVGLSGQMHSLVMLDADNCVIRPAILWCDQRTAAECAEIEQTVGVERLVQISGNRAIPAFTASKLLWVRAHEPENYARLAHILLAKDYIRFKLTGEYATERSDASGMQLLDINTGEWSDELCTALCVDKAMLGKVYESSEQTGSVTAEAAKLTGLPVGVPVAGGAGDNAAAAVGSAVCKEGRAFTTIGTSGVVFVPTSRPVTDIDGRFNTFCAALPGSWHVLGITQAAGLSMNWYRGKLVPELSYKELDERCESIPLGSEGLIYLPYIMGERTPILDTNARGVFFGLSALHTRDHMARAVIEGVSYSLYSCLEEIKARGVEIDDMTLCGGGSKSPLWQQILSDVYGVRIKTLASSESAAFGAAILGGVAAGVYPTVEEGASVVRTGASVVPDVLRHCEYMKRYAIYKSLYPALKDSFAALGAL